MTLNGNTSVACVISSPVMRLDGQTHDLDILVCSKVLSVVIFSHMPALAARRKLPDDASFL